MQVLVYLLSAFSRTAEGGNPAGVVLDAGELSVEQMKQLAAVVGYSETAFVGPSERADFKVRFFTPTEEVDLCGHATVALFALLLQLGRIKPGSYTQEIPAGVLAVEVRDDGMAVMDQTLPKFLDLIPLTDIQAIFDLDKAEILATGMPLQVVSTGLKDIMLPLANREILFNLKPDFAKMAALNARTATVGFHAFTLDTLSPTATAHCRNFAPLYAIDEESATGSANGALASYLFRYGKLHGHDLTNLVFEQGYSMGKPSEIIAGLETADGTITRVRVGGAAVKFGERVVEDLSMIQNPQGS